MNMDPCLGLDKNIPAIRTTRSELNLNFNFDLASSKAYNFEKD
jgi:hypothetical protein